MCDHGTICRTDMTDQNGESLIKSSISGRKEAVKILLSTTDINYKDKYGYTALMYASENEHTNIVEILLENNADPNTQDKIGNTALIYASYYGHTDIVRILLDDEADPKCQWIHRTHSCIG